MSPRRATLALLVAVALAGLQAPALAGPAEAPDPRSTIVLRYDCTSDLGRREVTLFANGTIRLRVGPKGEETMSLAELGPDELDGYLARLRQEDLSEAESAPLSVEGDWVERCVLEIPAPPGGESPAGDREFHFSRYSSLPLGLSRVVHMAEELGQIAEGRRGSGLPDGYRPRKGDVLERSDGVRFRVVDFTADGKGVELEGVETPLTLYLSPDQIAELFVSLVSRAGSGGAPR